MERDYITVGKASVRLGVTKDTIRRWIDDKKLKGYLTPNKQRMVSVVDIERILNGQ